MSGALARAHDLLVTEMAAVSHTEDPEDPSTVQAMQLAINLPKQNPPSRERVLADAASAVVKVCLDERAGVDGFWREGLRQWYSHRIRKVARRARNKAWDDVQALPGVTSGQVRAFVPSAVRDVPKPVAKLQVKGTSLEPGGEPLYDATLPTVHLNADLSMSGGKSAAQAGHGSMLLAAAMSLDEVRAWASRDFAVNIREVPAVEMEELCARPGAVPVRDAGFTEVAPNSLTVVALPGA